jgi:hypothetical protein
MPPCIRVYGVASWVGVAFLLIASPANGLSDTICDHIEADWQSDEPRLEGSFPFYTLLGELDAHVLSAWLITSVPNFPSCLHCAVSCSGNLSLEGYSVDSCVDNGTDCGSAAADAFCNYLGMHISLERILDAPHADKALPALTALMICMQFGKSLLLCRTGWVCL